MVRQVAQRVLVGVVGGGKKRSKAGGFYGTISKTRLDRALSASFSSDSIKAAKVVARASSARDPENPGTLEP